LHRLVLARFQVGFDPSNYDARARFVYTTLTYMFK
jgi:hypothetical protein